MEIAIASQNRRTITDHTGRCRRFWIYHVERDPIQDKRLKELPKEQSLHATSPNAPHPLDGVDVLICRGMGEGLQRRLAPRGIRALVTTETDPDRAVTAFLANTLPPGVPHGHSEDENNPEEGASP
ncbi:MAG TPA: NifB/NifX family molybdenum-iron cluster-binding protein [Gammaproteobacteria bacterium]|nr:NifB/NifX family molybdenum-iron cluster-binding protein [Gammaproteobacteria bacterium]